MRGCWRHFENTQSEKAIWGTFVNSEETQPS
jgi:hypothetical protein